MCFMRLCLLCMFFYYPILELEHLWFFIILMSYFFPVVAKPSSRWRRTEDVLKTSSRRLQCSIFVSTKTSSRHNCKTSSWRHLEDVLETYWIRLQHVFKKTSSRRLEDVFGRRIANTSWRPLQGVFKTSWRHLVKQEIFAVFIISLHCFLCHIHLFLAYSFTYGVSRTF